MCSYTIDLSWNMYRNFDFGSSVHNHVKPIVQVHWIRATHCQGVFNVCYFRFFLYMKEKMYLKLFVLIFLFKMPHILSFSSSNFEFLNMHISLGNFSRHMCDVIGVNRSMKRESVKALDQLSSPITNRWMIIIGF